MAKDQVLSARVVDPPTPGELAVQAQQRKERIQEALTNKPARKPQKFEVKRPDGKKEVFEADDENHARALSNDKHRDWPSPRMVDVTAVAA